VVSGPSAVAPPAVGPPAIHVERSGRGAPVVFWHGWGLNLRVYDALRAALNPDFRTIAVDLPGHGRSAWAAGDPAAGFPQAGLLDTLPQGTTLVGWSLGAQLALRAAARAPGRIARLVLIGATPRFVRSEDWPDAVASELLAQMHARLEQDCAGAVHDFLALQVRGSRDAAAVQATLRAALLEHGAAQPAALAAGLAALASTDLRPLLHAIDVPALVIAGQYDRVTPPAASAALAAALPRGRYLECPRAGHAPFLSHLRELLPELRHFMSTAQVA